MPFLSCVFNIVEISFTMPDWVSVAAYMNFVYLFVYLFGYKPFSELCDKSFNLDVSLVGNVERESA